MKKITLKFLTLMLLFAGAEWTSAKDVTFSPSSIRSGETSTSEQSITSDNVVITISGGTLNRDDNYRVYKNQTMTVTSTSGNIRAIKLVATASGNNQYGPGCFTVNDGDYTYEGKEGTWAGDASSVVFTAATNQVRMTSIVVTVEDGGVYVVAPSISPATGTYTSDQTVTITAESGLTAYYSLNGNDTFTKYTAPFTVSETTTIEAYAQDADGNKSSVVSAVITIVKLDNLNGSGTAADPYDVASALKLINAGEAPTYEVYVKGVVSTVDASSWSSDYKTLIYYISDDGSTTSQLEVYRGKALANEGFESADTLKTGDNVTVYGKLVLYGTTPEFTNGSYLFAWNSQTGVIPPAISPESGVYTEAQTVTITVENGLTAYYSINGADPVKYTAPFQVSETSTIVAYTQDANGNKSAEVTVTYTISSGEVTIEGDGTADNPYDVASAIHIITSGQATTNQVYVKGIISKLDSYNSTYKSITYWISDDGTTANQMQVYSGRGLGNTDFTALTDLNVGDKVTVCGVIKLYNNTTPEFDKENYIYELNGQGGGSQEEVIYKTIAEAKAAATADKVNVTLELSDVLVTYVNGQSNYVADATDGFLLYAKDLKYVAGQRVNTVAKGQLYLYNGLPELAVTSVESIDVLSEGNEIQPTVVEIEDLEDEPLKYSNMLVKLEDVEYDATAFADRNVIIWQNGEKVVVRDNWNVAATAEFDTSKVYDVTGFMAIYAKDGSTTIQLYPRSLEDLGAEKKPITIEGEGTFENPYTVNDIIQLYADGSAPEEDVWVKGYIVGCFKSTKNNFITDPKSEDVQPSNVVIADIADETDVNKCAPINLPTDPKDDEGNIIPNIRGKVNLLDNPDNMGKEVMFLGKIQAYFTIAGMKDVKDAIIDGEHANGIMNITAEDINNANIYTVAGQRVNQITRGGLYIVNGKKVLVK